MEEEVIPIGKPGTEAGKLRVYREGLMQGKGW